MPTQPLGRSFVKLVSCQLFWCGGLDGSRGGSRPRHGWSGVTLVLRTSWFNCSSGIHAKEITAIRVYGCRAFTSPRIFDFRHSIRALLPTLAPAPDVETAATTLFSPCLFPAPASSPTSAAATALLHCHCYHPRSVKTCSTTTTQPHCHRCLLTISVTTANTNGCKI
ncbi:hypothetical protein BHE74_00050152 [Ensete ventricosum]|nr:hypothetical protein GW17_00015526 [Ensete ventricosum]RWW44114.1 hypothetical protein BHE74_00050152 [Ensete ventricosum]RZS13635.1 hypothetical protein BHM03_00045244 [Ensete ventricosum]